MLPQIRIMVHGALAILLASCANVSLTTDYDRAADFSKYRTYAWVPDPPADRQTMPSIRETTHRAVDAGLAAKGYTHSAAPAFLVRARFAATDQIAMHHHTDWGGAGTWARRHQGGGYGLSPHTLTDVDRFTEAVVWLDLVDAETGRAIWRGKGEIVFGTTAENVRSVEEAVARLLKRFPPKQRRTN